MTRSMLFAAALLVLPAVAEAATLGTIPVDPNGGVTGTFTAPGTQTWRLSLTAGKDYAVDGAGDCASSVVVRAAGGKTLAAFMFSEEDESDGAEGASLRAPYTGSYAVIVTVTTEFFGGCAPSGAYSLRAARDCAGDASTRCAIAVGRTLDNLRLDYQNDTDWFRTTLAAGHAYRATLTGRFYCNDFAVLDARGRPLVGDDCLGSAAGTLTFTAPTSGTYFLAAKAFADPPEPYSLSLVPSP